MSEFTKGPWKVRDVRDYGVDTIIGADKNFVAETGSWRPEHKKEQHANAHLIASAPDMYEAIKKAYKKLDDSGAWDMYEDVADVMGDLKKALAKAEGKEE